MNYPTIGWLRGLFDAPPLEVPDHTTVASHSIDSRTLRHGDLFWAIRAQRDGHDFVADALAKGACAAVVNQEWFESAQAELLRGKLLTVGDTTDALQSAARHWRTRIQCNVIGITGSNGKTTTKDIATHLLGARFKTAGTAGNLNNELGVPLTLLGM